MARLNGIKAEPSASFSPADVRRCDTSLQLDIELLVLDYLIYDATEAVFRYGEKHARIDPDKRRQSSSQAEEERDQTENILGQLRLIDHYLKMFKASHPSDCVPEPLRFALHLLQFATIFILRRGSLAAEILPRVLNPFSLSNMRKANHLRSSEWHQAQELEPFVDALSARLPSSLSTTRSTHETQCLTAYPTSSNDCLLLDLMPMFIRLTAERTRLRDTSSSNTNLPAKEAHDDEWNTTERWLRLAASFMLHATLEYLSIDTSDSSNSQHSAATEAFAWGPSPHALATDNTIDAVFIIDESDADSTAADDTPPSATLWHDIRAHAQAALGKHDWFARSRDGSLSDDPAGAQSRYVTSLDAFERTLRGFLQSLRGSVAKPVLVQLDEARGQKWPRVEVAGRVLGDDETARLLEICWPRG